MYIRQWIQLCPCGIGTDMDLGRLKSKNNVREIHKRWKEEM